MNRILTILRLLNPALRARYDYDDGSAVAVTAAPFNRYLVGNEPDMTNQAIATAATNYIRPDRPYIGQWEQCNILRARFYRVIEYKTKGEGEWVQTHVLMKWVAEEVRKLGKGNAVILLGHPDHVRRVAILAMHYGLRPRVSSACKNIPYDPRKRPGYQFWCIHRWRYVLWEYCLARPKLILDLMRGKI